MDNIFFKMSKLHLKFGTAVTTVKYKVTDEARRKHKVSIFVPVFNEERIIDRDIKALDYIIKKLPAEYEIFIVNDSSKDKTKIIAQKIEQTNRKVKLVNYEKGPTRRENLAQSFKRGNGDIVAFVDVDLIASLRFLPDLIDQIILGYDIVAGSRYVSGSKIKRKPFRLVISLIYNTCIRFLFGTHMYDHLCGFKAFKRDVILRLVDEMGYDKSLTRGIFWDTELLIRARKHGYKIKEIPIWWSERKKSALYFKRELKTIGYIFKFMMKLSKEKNE